MKTPAPIEPSQKSQRPIEDDVQSVVFEPAPMDDLAEDLPAEHFESDEELPPMPPRFIILI